MTNTNKLEFDTDIAELGVANIPTHLVHHRFADDTKPLTLSMTSDDLSELDSETLSMNFEKAGPREKLYFDAANTKCAIVTCGGLCPGLNDVIRSIVMSAYLQYKIRTVVGIRNGLRGFVSKYGHDVIELTPEIVTNIHQFGGTILGTSRGTQPVEEIVDSLERMNINILFVIGGDGSMRAAKKIVEEVAARKCNISVIGVPKTIDNDINFITRSFGFDTAVEKATEVIQCAHVEATCVSNGIGLVKLMGREAGFIAAEATLALQEVNFLLVPEQSFKLDGEDGLLLALERRLKARKHAVIVCSEGAGQNLTEASGKMSESGNPVLGDICGTLMSRIRTYFEDRGLDIDMKFIDPSYIIRSVPANAGDRVYCGFLGQHAVHAAMAGKTGLVVTELKSSMVHLPLELVVQKRRTINTRSDYWFSVLETIGRRNYSLQESVVQDQKTFTGFNA
jgi:6-phosphofructokinase 1